jgi:hypothetical protein
MLGKAISYDFIPVRVLAMMKVAFSQKSFI